MAETSAGVYPAAFPLPKIICSFGSNTFYCLSWTDELMRMVQIGLLDTPWSNEMEWRHFAFS
jgi:hypothetical protein